MDIRAILMGLAFVVMWSSAFTSARIIVQNAPPLTVSSARFLISGTLALLIAKWAGEKLSLTPRQWRLTILFGLCQNGLYLGLNFVAMQTVEASLAAIIASSLPLWVALVGWLIWREAIGTVGLFGLIAGMAGTGLIVGTRLSAGVDPFGTALCVVSVLALTFATLAVRGATSGGNVLAVVGFQMLVGGVALAIPASFETKPFTWSPLVVGAFAYTVLIPGLLATIIWFRLVNRIGAVRAATFHFLNPFFGVLFAAILLGEALGPLDLLGVVIVTVGILSVQLARIRV